MTLPLVGVLVDEPTPPEFAAFVAELSRWCKPVAWSYGMPRPTAWITSSPAVSTPTDGPAAAWVGDAVQLRDGSVVSVGNAIDLTNQPAVIPFVRSRHRRARGLPEDLIVAAAGHGEAPSIRVMPRGDPLGSHLHGPALALASAVIARRDALLAALAWGAPCVTDAESAAALGASDGVHVVVVDSDGEPYSDALALGRDHRQAAALSRAGRRLVESRFDRVTPARRVADALGLRGYSPAERLDAALDQLATPTAAGIRARARVAVA